MCKRPYKTPSKNYLIKFHGSETAGPARKNYLKFRVHIRTTFPDGQSFTVPNVVINDDKKVAHYSLPARMS